MFCSIQDNCSTNDRMAQLLDFPHIGCLSHTLALEVKRMFEQDALIRAVIESVQRTTASCRRKLKCRASLCNYTYLVPITPNETWWSRKYRMLKRYNIISGEIAEVAKEQWQLVLIDTRQAFRQDINNLKKCFVMLVM